MGTNALVLAYASGWIIVPGALLALALVLGRPRSRAELAFGAIFLTTAVALLLEAGLAGEVEIAQERYVFYLLPLAAIAFCLYASRGWPARRSLALISSLLIVASSQVDDLLSDMLARSASFMPTAAFELVSAHLVRLVEQPRPKLLTLCESMLRRGDPGLAFTCRVRLDAEKK